MRYLTDEERKMAALLSQNEQIVIPHSYRMIGRDSCSPGTSSRINNQDARTMDLPYLPLVRPSGQDEMVRAARLVIVAGHDNGAVVGGGFSVDQSLRV